MSVGSWLRVEWRGEPQGSIFKRAQKTQPGVLSQRLFLLQDRKSVLILRLSVVASVPQYQSQPGEYGREEGEGLGW